MTLPTNIVANDSGHISHTNTIHAKINELLDLDGELSELVTPVNADRIYIERASDGAHFYSQVGNLPGGSGTDADAIHDNVAGEIALLSQVTAAGTDLVLIEDASDANNKKRVTAQSIADLGAAGTDNDAIHDNVSGEISLITEKTTPVGTDLILIEDSAASNAKKKVQITNLPTGSDADAIHDNVGGEINAITEKTTPVGTDLLLIEDSAASNAKKKVQITNLPTGNDADAIHDNVAAEISAVTEKTIPVGADLLLIEDSAASNAKKRVQVGNLPGLSKSVELLLRSNTEWDPAVDHNGSGTAWDPLFPNLLWHLSDDAPEGESGTYPLWCTEVDDPSNPTTETLRYRSTLANTNDLEALSFVQMQGVHYLLVWENSGDTVRIYERPLVVPGQTLVTETPIGGSNWSWSPGAGLDSNVESMRWNQWDGMLYFLTPRGAGSDDNDNARDLLRSADWRTATPTSLPATTLTKMGEVVTRPENSSPVPNANGDIDFLGEHVLLIAGVATNTTPNPDVVNNYVMYVTKDTDQDWDDVIPTAGSPNYPQVLAKTDSAGHENIAAHKATGVIWVGPESKTSATNVLTVTLNEGPFQFPSGGDTLPASSNETSILMGDTVGGWRSIPDRTIRIENFATDPATVSDWGPVMRAARDHGDTLGHPYVLEFGLGEFGYTSTETISVKDGETGANSNFEVGLHLPEGCVLRGQWPGHGRSGGDTDTDYASTVLYYSGSSLHDAIVLHYKVSPDWRGGGFEKMHFTDNSTARDRVLHGLYLQGSNMMILDKVSVSHIERAAGWGIWVDVVRNGGDTEDEPTQYGTMDKVNLWRNDNGIRIDGRNPDWKLTNGSILRDGGETPVAGKYGLYAATNKLSVVNYEIQFHETEARIHNHSANLGKHMTFINVHFEADTGASANSYNACVEMIGTSGQDELPLFLGCEVGNSGKYADYFKFTDVSGFRINDFRIRDNGWLAAADTKIEHTNSTGTVDGTSV